MLEASADEVTADRTTTYDAPVERPTKPSACDAVLASTRSDDGSVLFEACRI